MVHPTAVGKLCLSKCGHYASKWSDWLAVSNFDPAYIRSSANQRQLRDFDCPG